MSSYNELIKNFERIRTYMREFYVYGFKSRDEYHGKSARSYDDERRRMESWLGEHMRFVRTSEGKNVFISIDSRTSRHNPFYKAWKAKSFTDGDITLHFLLFDLLATPDIGLSLPEIMGRLDEQYFSQMDAPMMPDESTVRKKLKEYCAEGIVTAQKQGKRVIYRRAEDARLPDSAVLDFFSEVAPCGVIGSFLLDRSEPHENCFAFKHHYITGAMDSDVLAALFMAMRQKRAVTVSNLSRKKNEPTRNKIIPLRVLISVQNGRQHLLAYQPEFHCMKSFRIDYLSNVKLEEPTRQFDELRAMLDGMRSHMWGVNLKGNSIGLEHVEFTVRVRKDEDYIVRRLEREKRIGRIERLDEDTYRFTAEVYDSTELIPWIRTFICRITQMRFSNRTVENRFKSDLEKMYRMYGIGEGEDR